MSDLGEWASSGVYAITCTATGEQYVGSAAIFGGRWATHLSSLRKGKSFPRLQTAWDTYGEAAFRFEVLEIVDGEYALGDREQEWIGKLQPAYNTNKHSSRARRPKPAAARTASAVSAPHLKRIRLRKAYSKTELAALAGVARATINRAEAGGVVSFPNIRKLAEALGVDAQELIGEDDHVAVAV